jgi:hypothetical protein
MPSTSSVPLDCDRRDGLRSDQTRLPKDARKRAARARQSGVAGYHLLDGGWPTERAPSLRPLPALEAWRQRWGQPSSRCPVPGMAEVRGRTPEEQPPAAIRLTAPYEPAARSCPKRATPGVGSKLHLPETCEPAPPALLPPGRPTPSTTPDGTRGPPIVQDLAARALLPGPPRLDRGAGDAAFLGPAPQHQIDVVGPPWGA